MKKFMYVGKIAHEAFGLKIESGMCFTLSKENETILSRSIDNALSLNGQSAFIVVGEEEEIKAPKIEEKIVVVPVFEEKKEVVSEVVEEVVVKTEPTNFDKMYFPELKKYLKSKGIATDGLNTKQMRDLAKQT